MHPYPHRYQVAAAAAPLGEVELTANGLAPLQSAPPREFDGPGDRWSPETLLVAAVADCLVLTFRAVARAAHYEWLGLSMEVEGTLERPERNARFTGFKIVATLRVPAGANAEVGRQLLAKAEQGCLISNSLSGTKQLEARIETVA